MPRRHVRRGRRNRIQGILSTIYDLFVLGACLDALWRCLSYLFFLPIKLLWDFLKQPDLDFLEQPKLTYKAIDSSYTFDKQAVGSSTCHNPHYHPGNTDLVPYPWPYQLQKSKLKQTSSKKGKNKRTPVHHQNDDIESFLALMKGKKTFIDLTKEIKKIEEARHLKMFPPSQNTLSSYLPNNTTTFSSNNRLM